MPKQNKKNNAGRKIIPATKKRRSARNTAADPVFARYIRCLVDGRVAATGVPDGNNLPSFVRNIVGAKTFRPNANGVLELFVMCNPMGTVQSVISSEAGQQAFIPDASAATGVQKSSVLTGGEGIFGPQLAFAGGNPLGNHAATARVVNAVHKLTYTGPALYNGGTVRVTQYDLHNFTPETISTASSGKRPVLSHPGVFLNQLNYHTPDTLFGPARRDITLLNLPSTPDYVTPVLISAPNATPGVIGGGSPGFGWQNYTPRYYHVRYEGLDVNASITVQSRVCMQELLDLGSHNAMSAFARPSETASPSLLSAFVNSMGTAR